MMQRDGFLGTSSVHLTNLLISGDYLASIFSSSSSNAFSSIAALFYMKLSSPKALLDLFIFDYLKNRLFFTVIFYFKPKIGLFNGELPAAT
jgi:hypothetical protein